MTDVNSLDDIKDRLSKAIRAYYAGDSDSPDWMDDESYEELVAESGLSLGEVERLKRTSIRVVDKVRHKWPMGTLPKVHDLSEIKDSGKATRLWQLKYDGCSIEVHVGHGGEVDYACTRGDYLNGENRTKVWDALVSSMRAPSFVGLHDVSVRGELVVSDSDWRQLDGAFANQRNAASGIANRDDTSLVRLLTFIPYDVVDDSTGATSLYLGEMCPPTFDTFDQAEAAFRSADVPVDGVVCKDFIDGAETMAVAYKFSDRVVETTLRDVVWQRGRTGKLTPVAEFSPVFIDAEVTRASLGSYRRFSELDLHYGDRIEVRKANQIIPYVERNLGGGRSPVSVPKSWCGSSTFVDGANLFVEVDDEWRERLYRQVDELAGKGVSHRFVDDMCDGYGVTTLRELYDAVMDDSFSLPGYKEKRTAKVRSAIGEISSCDLPTFIASVGINGVSSTLARRLSDKAVAVADSCNSTPGDVIASLDSPYAFAYAIHGFGESAAKSFESGYGTLVSQLRDFASMFGDYPKASRRASASGSMTVCVTGRFDGFTRSGVARELAANGFSVSERVSRGVSALLAGEGGGASKRDAAGSLGVRIIESGGDLNEGLRILKTIDR